MSLDPDRQVNKFNNSVPSHTKLVNTQHLPPKTYHLLTKTYHLKPTT
ncbi:MAG: hypothetical protein F6K54_33330 [Okeania sp. SIO3B5]|nr:hypothetical protein [Okeania sp. SIO3B5]NEO57525.1 hypothetical protein [Okeania sp. SIO3B5]